MGAAYIRAELHKTIDSKTLTSTSVLNMGEADERYALKGEGGGGDNCGLTPEEVEKLSIYANAEGRSITPALNLATEVGHTYTVTAKGSDIDVTASNGDPLCSVPAGSQLSFVAVGATTKLSSTDCSITENFKGAAHVVLSGGGSSEGGGEPEGDYLLFNQNGGVTGGRLAQLKNGSYLRYNAKNVAEWSISMPSVTNLDYSFYGSDLDAISIVLNGVTTAKYAFYNTNLTEWGIALPRLQYANYMLFGTKVKSFEVDLPEVVEAERMFTICRSFSRWGGSVPKLKSAQAMFSQTFLENISFNGPSLESAVNFFYNTPTLKNVELYAPVLSNAEGFLHGCQVSKQSALNVCNALPTWQSGTHKITLGIHVDHKFDEEVLAAIALIDIAQTPVADGGKGWTVTVQWNGTASTASASTYRWGGRRDPVYAKLGESLEGKPTLDWGHYVTNWEANGYMEFASLEEAEEYFNIKK